MSRSEMKANPAPIIAAHFASLSEGAGGPARRRDYALFLAAPLAAAGLCYWRELTFSNAAGQSLLTLSGLLGALLFGALLLVSERAMNWADSNPPRGSRTSEQALYLSRLSANAAYASLACIAAAGAFLWVSLADGEALRIASALGVALGLQMVLVLLLVIRRVFLFTQARITDARVGGSSAHPSRRRGAGRQGAGAPQPPGARQP